MRWAAGWSRGLAGRNCSSSPAFYVDRLRLLAGEDHTHHVHRPRLDHPEDLLERKHPFQELRLSIWAPEEDTADYFSNLLPMALNVTPGETGEDGPALTRVFPPAGVDAGAFYDLVSKQQGTFFDNLLTIDKAKNNTSLVLLLEWRGWELLFPADAERVSWQMMDHHHQLQEVHFLKISHHGIHTGMPPAEMLDQLLPGEGQVASDGRPRYAVVATAPRTYSGVPDPDTLAELRGALHPLLHLGGRRGCGPPVHRLCVRRGGYHRERSDGRLAGLTACPSPALPPTRH